MKLGKHLGVWAAALIAATALGQTIHVDVDGSPCATCSVVGTDVSINASTLGAFNRINVYVTPENSGPIGTVTLSGTRTGGNATFDFIVSTGEMPGSPEIANPTRGATTWGGIAFTGSNPNALRDSMRLGGWISGDLTGPLSCKELYRLQVGGDVKGSVTATGTGAVIRRLLVDGTIQADDGGSPTPTPVLIEATNGNMEEIRAGIIDAEGGIHAPVNALNGSIGIMQCTGDLSVASPLGIRARDGILAIHADSIDATIVANANGGAGAVQKLWAVGGPMGGTIHASSYVGLNFPDIIFAAEGITGEIVIDGDFLGYIQVIGSTEMDLGPDLGGDQPASVAVRKFVVNGNLEGGIEITGGGDLIELEIDGSLDGYVQAPGSYIDQLLVHGDMFNDIDPFFAQYIWAGNIENIEVDGAIRGESDYYSTIAALNLYHLAAESIGTTEFHDGTFGRMRLGDVDVAGDSRGLFKVLPYEGLFRVGGDLLGYMNVDNDDPLGLPGQIIVNAANSGGQWLGRVRLDSPLSYFRDLWEGSSQPLRAPYYTLPSSEIGGGAVGLVPYTLYTTDCLPPHSDNWFTNPPAPWPTCQDDPLINTLFGAGAQTVKVRFYGPVRTDAEVEDEPALQPFAVWYYLSPTLQWRDVSDIMQATMKRGTDTGLSREIEFTCISAQPMPPGYYAITFNTTPPEQPGDRFHVYCDATLASPAPSPAPNMAGNVEYHFRVYPDCDLDFCVDEVDRMCPLMPGICYADLDDDGVYPGATIDASVDINDLIYFLQAFEDGCICVDLDDGSGWGVPDSGTDINDLIFFLTRFELGC